MRFGLGFGAPPAPPLDPPPPPSHLSTAYMLPSICALMTMFEGLSGTSMEME